MGVNNCGVPFIQRLQSFHTPCCSPFSDCSATLFPPFHFQFHGLHFYSPFPGFRFHPLFHGLHFHSLFPGFQFHPLFHGLHFHSPFHFHRAHGSILPGWQTSQKMRLPGSTGGRVHHDTHRY
jgi:hypothetical protein